MTIDLRDLTDSLSEDARSELIQHLLAEDTLFAAVLECVASENNETGHFFGADFWFGSERVLELRQKLIPLMPAVARYAVQQALEQRDSAKKKADAMWAWAWELHFAARRTIVCKECNASIYRNDVPSCPQWAHSWGANDEEVERMMKGEGVTP